MRLAWRPLKEIHADEVAKHNFACHVVCLSGKLFGRVSRMAFLFFVGGGSQLVKLVSFVVRNLSPRSEPGWVLIFLFWGCLTV